MGDVGSSCEELFELSRDTIASASLLDRQDKSGSAALMFPSDHLLNNEGQLQHAKGTQQPENASPAIAKTAHDGLSRARTSRPAGRRPCGRLNSSFPNPERHDTTGDIGISVDACDFRGANGTKAPRLLSTR